MLSLDQLRSICEQRSCDHHASLWQRHLFADFLEFAYADVDCYQSDFYVDAEQIMHLSTPESMTDMHLLYYGWHETGTHLWVHNASIPELSHSAILRYLHTASRLTAIKVLICRQSRLTASHYIKLVYTPVMHDGHLIIGQNKMVNI